jgi:hypothetical protein
VEVLAYLQEIIQAMDALTRKTNALSEPVSLEQRLNKFLLLKFICSIRIQRRPNGQFAFHFIML